jgi:hypothetical protein
MRENVLIAVVSVLVGLMVGYLAWGAATAWGSAQPGPIGTMMGGSMGSSMMRPMGGMGGMMGHGMMTQPNAHMMGDMNQHMAQCHQMMGSMMSMMQSHMPQAAPQSK